MLNLEISGNSRFARQSGYENYGGEQGGDQRANVASGQGPGYGFQAPTSGACEFTVPATCSNPVKSPLADHRHGGSGIVIE